MAYSKHILTLLALVACGMAWAVTPQQAAGKFVEGASLKHASVSICIMDIATGEVVAAWAPDQSEITASTMKVVTASTALYKLGPHFTFGTQVKTVGRIDGEGTLHGDIVIVGGGDPTLGSKHFKGRPDFIKETIARLKEIGVTRVEGAVVPDLSAITFPPVPATWTLEDLAWDYGTGCFGLCYADNVITLSFDRAGRQPGPVRVQPEFPSLKVKNMVTLSNPKNMTRDSGVEAYLDYTVPSITLWGEAERGSGVYGNVFANPAPHLLLCDRMAGALRQAGIEVGDSALWHEDKRPTGDEQTVLDYRSPELADIVASLLERSDNMYAEMVLRAIAAADGGRATTAAGCREVEKFWKGKGIDTSPLFMKDGCGLSRNGKTSSRFLCELLARTYNDRQEIGADLSKLLPVAGESGTVQMLLSKSSLKGELALKSGSMNAVHCYAGYYPASNPRYAVAILVNSFTGERRALRQRIERFFLDAFERPEPVMQ